MTRNERIAFLESKIQGVRVLHCRALEMFHQMMKFGFIFVAEFYRWQFVEHELTIHRYSTELDEIRGSSTIDLP